jgi:methylated-DNA-[protein]-cysteine S-methyltransferase
MKIDLDVVEAKPGRLLVATRDGAACAIVFEEYWPRMRARLERRFGALDVREARTAAGDAVRAYLDGDLRALDAVPVDARGTPFQEAVWRALRDIPPGETRSYADIAKSVGAPRATRAVGAANGQNPVSIVLPCHRVVRTGGELGGYGGGIERKRWLLAHEARAAARS